MQKLEMNPMLPGNRDDQPKAILAPPGPEVGGRSLQSNAHTWEQPELADHTLLKVRDADKDADEVAGEKQ